MLHFLLPVRKTMLIQGGKHFLFREAKAVRIFFGGDRYHFQVIQVRKNGFLAHPGNARHHCTLQVGVGLEGSVE